MVGEVCSRRSPRGDRKRLKEEYFPLFVLFVLFGQAKRTLKEKKHKETFIFSYFSVTKSTKSHLRGLSALLKNSLRAHELVARAVRGKCVRHRVKRKPIALRLSAASTIPRVRTYHTKKPSRFVHALSARPLKVQGGREFSLCADGMESISFILSVGCAWALSCRGRRLDDPHGRGIDTYAKHVCWRRRDGASWIGECADWINHLIFYF